MSASIVNEHEPAGECFRHEPAGECFRHEHTTDILQSDVDHMYNNEEAIEIKQFDDFLTHRTPPKYPEQFDAIVSDEDKTKKYKLKQESNCMSDSISLSSSAVVEEANEKGNKLSKTKLKKLLKSQSEQINKEANEIKKKGEYLPDYDYIDNNYAFFNKYLKPTIPIDNDMNIEKILRYWTPYKYSPYNDLKTNYIRRVGERVVLISLLNDVFGKNFFTYMSNKSYRFDSLNFELLKFIGTTPNNDKIPTKFEHVFIKTMLSKLIVCMLSDVERCFTKDEPQLNNYFKLAIKNSLNEFAYLLKTDNVISLSWTVFEKSLFMSNFNRNIYKFTTAEDLKKTLTEAFKSEDFLMEQLAANILKTFIPTVAYSYFSVIKNIYIIGRLLSIYVNKRLFANKSKREIETDLYVIAAVLTTEYETNYVANVNIRTAPMVNGKQLTKQTEMYYVNHIIAGPQYLVLKMLENALPTLADGFALLK